MRKLNISLFGRWQNAFGVAGALAHEQYLKAMNIPLFKENSTSPSDIVIQNLYDPIDTTFADVVLHNKKTNKSYAFGLKSLSSTQNYIAPPLMLNFGRDKNVVKTAIDRSDIEVIEYFGLKPWQIKMQGILIDIETHQYPESLVRKVVEIFSSPGTFSVEGTLFDDKGITEIFIDSGFQVEHVEGYVDTVKFTLNAISTYPTEFYAKGF